MPRGAVAKVRRGLNMTQPTKFATNCKPGSYKKPAKAKSK